MPVYVDTLKPTKRTRNWRFASASHLVADSEAELLQFAASIKLKPAWLQRSRAGVQHFDLTETARRRAVRAGAIELNRRDFAKLIRKLTLSSQIETIMDWRF